MADSVAVAPLLKDFESGVLIANTVLDTRVIASDLDQRDANVVIAQHQRRTEPLAINRGLCRRLYLTESLLRKLLNVSPGSHKLCDFVE